jgi:hypothetical protein
VVEFSESERWLRLRRGNIVCFANLGEARRITLPFAPETTLASNCAIEGREAAMRADSVVIAARGRE